MAQFYQFRVFKSQRLWLCLLRHILIWLVYESIGGQSCPDTGQYPASQIDQNSLHLKLCPVNMFTGMSRTIFTLF